MAHFFFFLVKQADFNYKYINHTYKNKEEK